MMIQKAGFGTGDGLISRSEESNNNRGICERRHFSTFSPLKETQQMAALWKPNPSKFLANEVKRVDVGNDPNGECPAIGGNGFGRCATPKQKSL
jgi:hypothetical protein